MRRIRSKDTQPELIVRRAAHALGYRFRLHQKKLPGSPDLVFPSRKKVIFVHGCFWHQHSRCVDGRIPKSRTDYWEAKLMKNRKRDSRNRKMLREGGWKYLVIWDCQTKDSERLCTTLKKFLGD